MHEAGALTAYIHNRISPVLTFMHQDSAYFRAVKFKAELELCDHGRLVHRQTSPVSPIGGRTAVEAVRMWHADLPLEVGEDAQVYCPLAELHRLSLCRGGESSDMTVAPDPTLTSSVYRVILSLSDEYNVATNIRSDQANVSPRPRRHNEACSPSLLCINLLNESTSAERSYAEQGKRPTKTSA